MEYKFDKNFAEEMDKTDPLRKFRNEFHIPQHEGKNSIYFTGNSLGLMPKKGEQALLQELEDWKNLGVEGHMHSKNPWYSYHEMFKQPLSEIVGAKPVEVTAMNSLTTNLHLLMVSFYKPSKSRFKILCEAKAFPSDQYALESQVNFHGYTYEEAVIEINPKEGEHTLRNEDVISAIEENKESLALVMIGGVNYYTGQLFDMQSIAKAAKEAGANVGFDLAHAAGNVQMNLHDWNVDFAAWCSYKYLNSGPGSVGGVFVHEKHSKNSQLPRFAGWWGTPSDTRFMMEKGFVPAEGADAWQLSNAPVLAMAVHKTALDLHIKAGMPQLVEKQKKLTGYLEFLLKGLAERSKNVSFEIITPRDKQFRGSQLSILTKGFGKEMFSKLMKKGVIADWREPNVIRVAPVPIYNSYMDVYNFAVAMEDIIKGQ